MQRFELTHEQRRMKGPHGAERMRGKQPGGGVSASVCLDEMRKLPSLALSERDESGKN